MAVYSGKDGTIAIGAVDVAHMSSFSLSLEQDIHEIVSFGNRFKEKLGTILDWSCSAEGTADFETASGQKELYDAWLSGELVEVKLQLDKKTGFVGSAIVESFSIDHDAEGAAEVSIELAGSNAIVLTVAP